VAEKEGGTPRWMKKLVRARMKETGEKYTQALRAIKEQNPRLREEG
jgi:hypothetical protein